MLGWQLYCHPGAGSTTAGPTEAKLSGATVGLPNRASHTAGRCWGGSCTATPGPAVQLPAQLRLNRRVPLLACPAVRKARLDKPAVAPNPKHIARSGYFAACTAGGLASDGGSSRIQMLRKRSGLPWNCNSNGIFAGWAVYSALGHKSVVPRILV